MDNIRRVAIVACVIFAGALLGDLFQWLLPAHHLSDAKGVITTVQGLVTALLALVLGLLIWTSYGVYAQQHAMGGFRLFENRANLLALDRPSAAIPIKRVAMVFATWFAWFVGSQY